MESSSLLISFLSFLLGGGVVGFILYRKIDKAKDEASSVKERIILNDKAIELLTTDELVRRANQRKGPTHVVPGDDSK